MYKVTSSERTRSTGASFETKALLYLAAFHPESEKIKFFIIDLFNDVTGTTRFDEKSWDVQAKANKNQSAKEIGKNLVTLFKNYLSDFDFTQYILFIGGTSTRICVNQELKSFGIENINSEAIENMVSGLIEESKNKEYIDNRKVEESVVRSFLKEVQFVIGDKEDVDYVKALIKVKPKIIPKNSKLKEIFKEIRMAQSGKKEESNVEGKILEKFSDYKKYRRHISSEEIRMLVLHRILNYDFSNTTASIPAYFTPILDQLSEDVRKDVAMDCQDKICRMLFDNENANNFWKFFENVYTVIMNNPKDGIEELYEKIDHKKMRKNYHLDVYSAKYFLAIVKDGISVY